MTPLPEVVIANDEPLYNIGVVSRMTGISMATLRAWERRYDFPEASRTSGGHRLYSERDIVRLQWVKGRIDEGMQTAQSINALRHQEQTGHVIQPRENLVEVVPGYEERIQQVVGEIYQQYRSQLVEALTQHSSSRADQVINEALAVLAPEEIILRVIAPTIAVIGDRWQEGSVDIATEHMATNYLRHRLLMWMLSGPPPLSIRPIILACAPGEWHEGSLLIMGALLRRRRYPVAYLGQSVPLEDLSRFVTDMESNMVILVAMTENSASNLIEWPERMPGISKNGKPIISYSGRVFVEKPEWRQRMKGVFLGNTFQEGIETVEKLLQEL
ncbi:MAG TPA: B12-binding domain-containing protein [Anaerolineales bacterium]|nr:B12-binding domain-containing protein [Anaerolineales bacterium]